MNLSITSIVTACLLDSLLIICICILAKKDSIICRMGPECMIFIMLTMILRMFVPFEFSYTHSIWIEDTLSFIMTFFLYPVFSQNIQIMVWHVLITVWAIGILLGLAHSILKYRSILRYTKLLPEEKWELILEKYHLNRTEFENLDKIKLVYSQGFFSPCVMGISHPCLILPEMDYPEKQFYYIFLHEFMHVKNRDIIWKVLIDMLCIMFWWNPIFRYLRKELFQLIEMRNDMRIVAKLSEEEEIEYMQALKDTAVQARGKEFDFCVSFKRRKDSELKRRMTLLKDRKYHRWQQAVFCILTFGILFLTSTVVIEPYTYKNIQEEGEMLTDENTYLVKNKKKYDVYVYGEYAITVENTEGFENVIIYNTLQEAKENE